MEINQYFYLSTEREYFCQLWQFHRNSIFLMVVASFSWMLPTTLQSHGLRNATILTWYPNFPDLNRINHPCNLLDNQFQSMGRILGRWFKCYGWLGFYSAGMPLAALWHHWGPCCLFLCSLHCKPMSSNYTHVTNPEGSGAYSDGSGYNLEA